MTKTSQLLLGATLLLAPTIAFAEDIALGDWFAPRLVGSTENTANGWGAAKGLGWQSPGNIAGLNIAGAAHRVCIGGIGNSAWVGLALSSTVGGSVRLRCATYAGTQNGGTVFQFKPGRPAPVWIGGNASTPEPRSTVVLATQPSGRRLMACNFSNQSGDTYIGYIGDDGKCYGKATSGKVAQNAAYRVLVKKGSGSDAQPAYGWIPTGRGYAPHGKLASANTPDSNSLWTQEVQACRVNENYTNWPGWIGADGLCKYFTYINGQIATKTATRFDRYRVQPGEAASPYVFSRVNNENVYACTSHVTVNGRVQQFMMGFTTKPAACVDGTRSTTKDYAVGSLRLKWSTPTLLALNPEPQRG